MYHTRESPALTVAQVILKEREERKQNRLLEERDPTRMTCEGSQNPHASENLVESSLMQQSHEPTSNHVFKYNTHHSVCVMKINL